MKVSVITLHTVPNYGSVLQALATQKLFESHGFDVEIINYVRSDMTYKNLYNHWGGNNLIKRLIIHPTIKKWKSVFGDFCKEKLNLSKDKYIEHKDFEAHPINADLYCTGSDQVWNSIWNKGVLGEFYLDFAPEGSYKFAFSASIGKNNISPEEVEATKAYIDDYRMISMRENSSVDLVKSKYNFPNICNIIDPTLGIDRKEWRKIMKPVKIDGEYILIYNLNRSKSFDNYAKRLSEKTGMKLVRLCTRYDQFYRVGKSILIPEIKEFIGLINNARYVLTDSFHATAFSLNMGTEPICVLPAEFGNRVKDFLTLMNCEERLISDFNDFSVLSENVDFNQVDKVLESERKKMHDYINAVISDFKEFKKKK